MRKMTLLTIVGSSLLLAACGGGGAAPTASLNTPLTGVFLDDAVQGLEYETDTMQGITGVQGDFLYHQGETVRFHLGDIELGQAMAESVMTPVHLVNGAVDETDPVVTNMLMFLQTMDADGDPTNGIMLTAGMRQEAIGMPPLDFTLSEMNFRNDADMNHLLDTLNQGYMFTDGNHAMVRSTDAQNHLRTTMQEHGLGPFANTGDGNGMNGHMP